jgi:uncharacterized membrane protein YeaQ/YmgE (transglycosylase-associated protein family)
MDILGTIVFVMIGGLAGWQAGTLMKGGGFGLQMNIIIGILGGVAGGFLFRLLASSVGGLIGSMVTAILGAVFFLFLMGFFKKA